MMTRDQAEKLGLVPHPFTVQCDRGGIAVPMNRHCTVCGFLPADHLALVRMVVDATGWCGIAVEPVADGDGP